MPGGDLQPVPAGKEKHFSWCTAPALQAIAQALDSAKGGSVMFVGGCVRDSLLGQPPRLGQPDTPTDIDIATTLLPDETIAALEAARLKAIPTGYDHGTITAVSDGVTAEITTLRADVDTDGRRAVVQYTDDWEQDWRRRDFTINAIYLTPDCGLYDPAGGVADLAANKVVFIGDEQTRIREDYLRILRFYRFSARFAAEMDGLGTKACAALHRGLRQVSAERIGHEVVRILEGPRVPEILTAMQADSVLDEVFPEPGNIPLVEQIYGLTQKHGGGSAPLFLAALWADIAAVTKKLRLSNAQAKQIRGARKAAQWLEEEASEARAKELLYRGGSKSYADGVLLAWANDLMVEKEGKANTDWKMLHCLPGRWTAPANPFSGPDFQKRGIADGPVLGRILAEAERSWIAADYPDAVDQLDAIREAAIKSQS